MNEEITGLIRAIQRRNMGRLEETGYQSLIEDLKMDEEFVFTGWFLFTINRYLLLTFLSAIISFTVLLIQMGSGL